MPGVTDWQPREVTWEQGPIRALALITLQRNLISTISWAGQGLSQDLETGAQNWLLENIWASTFLMGTAINSDFNHKHEYVFQNKAAYA